MRKIRSVFYMFFAITLLFYGLPRFKLDGIKSMPDGFAILWTLLAVIIIGAHLFEILGVNRDREHKRIQRVRQY